MIKLKSIIAWILGSISSTELERLLTKDNKLKGGTDGKQGIGQTRR